MAIKRQRLKWGAAVYLIRITGDHVRPDLTVDTRAP